MEAPAWGTATNITFTTDSSDTTVPWTIEANSTTVSFNETLELYIVPTNGSYAQVGFVSTSGKVPTGGVTTGFSWFGTQVAYAASASDYELMFWATPTNTTDIYGLYVRTPIFVIYDPTMLNYCSGMLLAPLQMDLFLS